ncbi:MAG: dihydropteroate synthase [Thermodesulfobacteriota bacterium]|nr:dihydropteroate synthase [Thermodesulfobacteriota bacterium]
MKKPLVMGILNVTPDSFSDGGSFTSEEAIVRQVEQMILDGADSIDVGGESTRPFAEPVPEQEELNRVIPAIKAIRKISSTIPVSIDTTKASVAGAALAAGATMVNDISALRHDPEMVEIVKEGYDGPVIIMHMQGTPGDMQVKPHYEDVVAEICTFFTDRIAWMEAQGINPSRIIIDPGIGFGKTLDHNLTLLRNIRELKKLGHPVLIGHSRKSFFDKLLRIPVEKRDCPSAIVSALCAKQEADILRVHDVGKTVAAIRLAAVL